MNDAMQNVGDILEAAKGYGGWATSCVISVLYWNEKRQGRDGGRIKSLFEENTAIRLALHDLEDRHDRYRKECERRDEELRSLMRQMADTIDGLKRQIIAQSVATVRASNAPSSPLVDQAMDSLIARIGDPAHPEDSR